MTPSGRALFWADEPRSAITPPRPKINKRHGPKVVSSAWKSGSMPSGKTRGRPPINRTPIDVESPWTRDIPPFPSGSTATATTAANLKTPSSMHLAGPGSVSLVPNLPPPAAPTVIPPLRTEALSLASAALPVTSPSVTSKPARPAISLSVPERSGAPVRLATPPPPLPPPAHGPTILQPAAISIPPILTAMQDNETTTTTSAIPQPPSQSSHPQVDVLRDGIDAELNIKGTGLATLGYGTARPTLGLPPDRCADRAVAEEAAPSSAGDRPNIASLPAPRRGFFDSFDDRTNVDALFSHFVLEAMMADWVDAEGNPAESASAEEASAIITTIIESLWRSSTSNESFLINVAALAGARCS
ncbi:unnamed protein product [Parascedosporium putredinis]|uniref:Uncharacterized protein n=1 Tax=Parascedosporium putredinis TaxID=1442378 RepID=A0A9P1GWW7_9PEZI|nr:unnamed protein product [Parascedosporium putredinis]CAI7989298.1 unnamed protein product [Parascedosporium putredinis]